jgi:serine/threonine protein kinase
MTPERFGRYVLLERIGVGGMAEVFRAVMPGADGWKRTFVVKRILAELSQTGDFVEMFVREARIGALLNHPNIVQMYDFGNVEGNYFLAMEYLRGRDLSAVLRMLRRAEGLCPIPVAAFVAREVAECLGYAHALVAADGKPLNLIHRDVSPSNIMCLSEGGVKLLDFGIAKALGDTVAERTEGGAFKGKLSYMAPERVKREPIDGRADLFSLGVVLWEMLTGRRLFRGKSDLDTLKNVLEAEIPVPSSVRPEVPSGLDFVVMRALERDPSARYPSGHAMAEDLEDVLRETKYQSKMLPNLLRELFGSALRSGSVPLTEVTPGLYDVTSGRGTPTPGADPSVPIAIAPRWSFRGIATGMFAASATAVLLALLFGRGGGGRSHATTLPIEAAKVAAVRPVVEPVVAAPPVPAAEPAPAAEPTAPEAAGAEKPAEGSSGGGARHHHSLHSRAQGDRDRIARGLSIDPFAEAAARRDR